MGFTNFVSCLKGTPEAVSQVIKEMVGETPDLILVFFTILHDGDYIRKEISKHFPSSELIGVSSFRGVLTQKGFAGHDNWALAVTCYSSNNFKCGVGLGHSENGFAAGGEAIRRSLESSGRSSIFPDFLMTYSTSGQEEKKLQGIFDYLGASVPLSGATAGSDLDMRAGFVFDKQQMTNSGIVVSSFFSRAVVSSFLSGYKPLGAQGVITRTKNRRIFEIDHRPAADVYREWVRKESQGDCTSETSLFESITYPLGRELTHIGDMPFFLMSQPLGVKEGRSLEFHCEFSEGEVVHLMCGSEKSMLERTPKILRSLKGREGLTPSDIDGCIIIFCAGYLIKLIETGHLEEVSQMIQREIPGVPFSAMFSFGEQGTLLEEEAHHGNLMIAVTLFKKTGRNKHDYQ